MSNKTFCLFDSCPVLSSRTTYTVYTALSFFIFLILPLPNLFLHLLFPHLPFCHLHLLLLLLPLFLFLHFLIPSSSRSAGLFHIHLNLFCP